MAYGLYYTVREGGLICETNYLGLMREGGVFAGFYGIYNSRTDVPFMWGSLRLASIIAEK